MNQAEIGIRLSAPPFARPMPRLIQRIRDNGREPRCHEAMRQAAAWSIPEQAGIRSPADLIARRDALPRWTPAKTDKGAKFITTCASSTPSLTSPPCCRRRTESTRAATDDRSHPCQPGCRSTRSPWANSWIRRNR